MHSYPGSTKNEYDTDIIFLVNMSDIPVFESVIKIKQPKRLLP